MNQNFGRLGNDELEANVQRFKFLDRTQKIYRRTTSAQRTPEPASASNGASSFHEDTPRNQQFPSSVPTWEELVGQMMRSTNDNPYHKHSAIDIRRAVKVLTKKLEMTNRQLAESQKNKELLTLKIRELEDRLKANAFQVSPSQTGAESRDDYLAKTMGRWKELAAECSRREKLVEELEQQERFLRANLQISTDTGGDLTAMDPRALHNPPK